MKYNLDDIPEIRNDSTAERRAQRILSGLTVGPQAEGLHFVTGDYDQDYHGETVVLFNGDEEIQSAFTKFPNKPSQADPAANRKCAIMQQWLDEYAAKQEG